MKGFTMNLKSLKLQELTHKTLKQIAEESHTRHYTIIYAPVLAPLCDLLKSWSPPQASAINFFCMISPSASNLQIKKDKS
jgi:hypothetical protein